MFDVAVGGFGFLMVLLLYVAPILLIVVAIRWAISGGIRDATKNTEGSSDGRSARRILDERYARGELSRDEYRQVRQDIEAG